MTDGGPWSGALRTFQNRPKDGGAEQGEDERIGRGSRDLIVGD